MILNMTGKGGGGTVLVSDTLDANGGTIRTITAKKIVTLQTKTITPTSSVQTVNPDTGYDGFSQVTVNAGGGTGSNDFVIMFSYNSTTEQWEPNKTYTEIQTAFNAGKNLVSAVDSYDAQTVAIDGYFDGYAGDYFYFVYDNGSSTGVVLKETYDLDWTNTIEKINNEAFIVPNLQTKSVTPTESSQTVIYDSAYNGLSQVTVGAISTTYVGSGITRRSSSDLTASGATVTVPAGYYSSQTTKSVTSGSASAPSTISGTSATVSTGTNTLTLTKTVSVTPTVSAGYVSAGTATNSSVSLTASVTTKAAATITPTTTNQTIASGTYLTGTQTIAGDADLVASNIVSGVQIFGVTGNVVLQNYYTGSSAPSSSLGSNGDLYLQS